MEEPCTAEVAVVYYTAEMVAVVGTGADLGMAAGN